MRQAAKGIEQYLGPAPGWGVRRYVEQHLALYRAEPSVEMGFLGELLFDQADPETRQSSFEGIELKRRFHGAQGAPREPTPQSGRLGVRFGKLCGP